MSGDSIGKAVNGGRHTPKRSTRLETVYLEPIQATLAYALSAHLLVPETVLATAVRTLPGDSVAAWTGRHHSVRVLTILTITDTSCDKKGVICLGWAHLS